MMSVGRNRIKSHMVLEYDFTGIRIIGASLIPADWHLSVDLVAVEKKSGSTVEDIEYHSTVAYQRLYFWLDTNLPNIVVVNVEDANDLYIANLSANIMLYCPDVPYDDIIAQLLHSKLTVLADGHLRVGEIRIRASDMSTQYAFDTTGGIYELPELTSEYYTSGVSKDLKPWWMRNDGYCFEFIRPDGSELSNEELFKDIVDPMEEFNRAIKDASDKCGGIVREPARIVQVERWRPKKI